jgi:hypothetical protein
MKKATLPPAFLQTPAVGRLSQAQGFIFLVWLLCYKTRCRFSDCFRADCISPILPLWTQQPLSTVPQGDVIDLEKMPHFT